MKKQAAAVFVGGLLLGAAFIAVVLWQRHRAVERYTFTLMVDGEPTALTCTTGRTGECRDDLNSVHLDTPVPGTMSKLSVKIAQPE